MKPNIETQLQFDDLILVQYLKSIQSPFLSQIGDVYNEIKDILNNRIQVIFPNYTLHNTAHSFRIIEYMAKIVSNYKDLNELEIVLLIYSALLHDIGMAVSEDDIELIKHDHFPDSDIKYSAMLKVANNDGTLALQEYVRRIHASLSARYIRKKLKEKLIIPDLPSLDFSEELALICESHTQDYDWLKKSLNSHNVRGKYTFNAQFIAAILRLSDILDIDGNRTPYKLYQLISPKNKSDEEWKQHFVILNNNKISFNTNTQQRKIVFHGKCHNANIHRKILAYIGWVKEELLNAMSLVSGMPAIYSLIYEGSPEVNIQTIGYTFSDYKMTLEFKAITTLLMGEKIYGSKNLGLRELIQNAIDACKLRQESEERTREFGADRYIPAIKIILDQTSDKVIIKDNGIGMSLDIIKKHFLNIGVSYYTSTEFALKDFEYKPIGNFGIGFLSCFMLSNDVSIFTRHYQSQTKYLIELEKNNEWSSITEIDDIQFVGTEIILNYTSFIKVFNDNILNVHAFIKMFFITDNIKFEIINKIERKIEEIENKITDYFPRAIHSTLETNSQIKIDLANYLHEFEGYVVVKPRKNFIRCFKDLPYQGDLYTYNSENRLVTAITDDNNLSIDDYINDNKIKYLSLPLVTDNKKDDFLNGMKFTENNVEEVIQKLNNDLKWVSIFITKELQERFDSGFEIHPDDPEPLFVGLRFSDIEKLGHAGECSTYVYIKSIDLFEGEKDHLYLPFQKLDRNVFPGRLWYYRPTEEKTEVFIRNVWIKDLKIFPPVIASVFDIEKIKVNIMSRKFVPDITRNNLSSKDLQLLEYIIGKAVHVAAIEYLHLAAPEKETIQTFIKKYYNKTTSFEINPNNE